MPKKLAVVVHDDGFNVIVGDNQKPLPRKAGELTTRRWPSSSTAMKHAFPDRTDVQVISADGIVFDSSCARWTRR